MRLTRRSLLGVVSAVGVLVMLASIALAEEKSSDEWKPVNTPFVFTSSNTVFTLGTFTNTCPNAEVKGKTPAGNGKTFADLSKIPVIATFLECKPGAVTTTTEGWTVELHSLAMEKVPTEHCEAGAKLAGQTYSLSTEDDDCVLVTVPAGGATITVPNVCTITIGASKVVGYLDDEWTLPMGKPEKTVEGTAIYINEQEVQIASKKGALCPAANVATFKAHYFSEQRITD